MLSQPFTIAKDRLLKTKPFDATITEITESTTPSTIWNGRVTAKSTLSRMRTHVQHHSSSLIMTWILETLMPRTPTVLRPLFGNSSFFSHQEALCRKLLIGWWYNSHVAGQRLLGLGDAILTCTPTRWYIKNITSTLRNRYSYCWQILLDGWFLLINSERWWQMVRLQLAPLFLKCYINQKPSPKSRLLGRRLELAIKLQLKMADRLWDTVGAKSRQL